jgi:hypothetical protein
MVKDPLTTWDGLFPYDALASVGITPASSMKEILDASFDLMAQGLMTSEVRQAWDQLRFPEKRLFVDFFLYQVDLPAEIARISEELADATLEEIAPTDLSALLTIDPDIVRGMEQDFRDIPLERIEVPLLSEFDQDLLLPGTDVIAFDK